jgi:protein involved in polysaccharide export with SLBB domain
MAHKRIWGMLGVLILAAGIGGCFSSKPENISAFKRPYEAVVVEENYTLMPPDEVEIHCSQVAELSQGYAGGGVSTQRQTIRPDGKISFEILGEFEAAGKTIEQVTEAIRAKANSLYKLKGDQPIDLRVTVYKGQNYYVVGEVKNPGAKVCTGRDRLQHALSDAEPTVTGWWKHVQVVHPNNEDKTKAKVFEVDYNKMIRDGDLTKDVLLQPGDIVYVPLTPMAALANVIAEFTKPITEALAPVYQVTYIQNQTN